MAGLLLSTVRGRMANRGTATCPSSGEITKIEDQLRNEAASFKSKLTSI
jgi:hypothetical protein